MSTSSKLKVVLLVGAIVVVERFAGCLLRIIADDWQAPTGNS